MSRFIEWTEDAVLGGRVRLRQPRQGYRAATDPVLLAAAAPALPGAAVLDLGCGVGAAMFCLAARVPGVRLTGLEIQPAYAAFARDNAVLNGVPAEVIEGDVAAPAVLGGRAFDVAMTNPPYHHAGPPAGDAGRAVAHHGDRALLAAFLGTGLRRLRPGGHIVVIHRAERLGDLLACLGPQVGDVRILPVAARAGRAAKRVIVRARKGARGPLGLLAPLVMHDGADHGADRPDFSAVARAVLNDGAALALSGSGPAPT